MRNKEEKEKIEREEEDQQPIFVFFCALH